MEYGGDIAGTKPSEPHTATVERDLRRPGGREPHPAAVELAEHEPRWSQLDDETAVDSFTRCRTRRRKHERDAKHQPEPSHSRILGDLRQSLVCSV
jgi:hypothetical protein